jgi:hypothetical protein
MNNLQMPSHADGGKHPPTRSRIKLLDAWLPFHKANF